MIGGGMDGGIVFFAIAVFGISLFMTVTAMTGGGILPIILGIYGLVTWFLGFMELLDLGKEVSIAAKKRCE